MVCNKTVLRGNFTVINRYLQKKERSQTTQPYPLTNYKKEKQIKPKVSGKKEITKIRTEINKTDTEYI